jgi:uncharacterized membrane protein YfcA
MVLIGLAILAGAALQAATGFGFGLVVAPVAFALLEPEEAIWLITLLAIAVNVLTLGTEGRRPVPLRRDTALLVAWSVPGALAGVAFLRAVDEVLLQVVVTAVVLGSLALRRWQPHVRLHVVPAGLAAGALNLATGTGGPPVVLYLLGLREAPDRVRDTLTAFFLVSGLAAVAILAATGTEPLPRAAGVAAALPVLAVGHVAGRRLFRRLADGGYEAALVLVLLATAAGGLARALG